LEGPLTPVKNHLLYSPLSMYPIGSKLLGALSLRWFNPAAPK